MRALLKCHARTKMTASPRLPTPDLDNDNEIFSLTRKRFQLCQADFFQTRLNQKVNSRSKVPIHF